MTLGRDPARRQVVGFFGKLGAGNYGNDGSLEAMLAHLRDRHPSAEFDCMAAGPDVVQGALRHPRRRPELGPGRTAGPASVSSTAR